MDQKDAELVLDWYLDLECRFTGLLGTIPYGPESETIILPSISSVVLEACSLIDTVFRTEFRGHKKKTRDLKMPDYAVFYENAYAFSERRTVHLRYPIEYVVPFDGWIANKKYKGTEWWKAYNELKHDRIANYSKSTMKTALHSLCALHQIVAVLPSFINCLLRRNLMLIGNWNPLFVKDVLNGETSNADYGVKAAFETDLFCSPTRVDNFPSDILQLRFNEYGPSRIFRNLAYIDREVRREHFDKLKAHPNGENGHSS